MPLTRSEDDSDQVLLESLVQGDAEALGPLMRRHERWVRGVLFAVLGNADEVDDVLQQVWLTFWNRCGELDDLSRWRYWLYRLARNAAIDAGRKTTRRRRLWSRLTDIFSKSAKPVASPDREAILAEEHGRVLDAIARIPPIYREAFVLRHVQDLTYQEIADIVGVAPATVGTRLVRARKQMLDILKTDGNDD